MPDKIKLSMEKKKRETSHTRNERVANGSWQLEKAGNDERQIEKPVVKYGKVAWRRIPRMCLPS